MKHIKRNQLNQAHLQHAACMKVQLTNDNTSTDEPKSIIFSVISDAVDTTYRRKQIALSHTAAVIVGQVRRRIGLGS